MVVCPPELNPAACDGLQVRIVNACFGQKSHIQDDQTRIQRGRSIGIAFEGVE